VGFDAVVGNNDRHFFNWGVITQISDSRPPRFSPIYDTARALFWNTDERGLERFGQKSDFECFLRKYVEQCFSKTGWDGLDSPNHFALVRQIVEERPRFRDPLAGLNRKDLPNRVEQLLTEEFEELLSVRRQHFIVSCLQRRLDYYDRAVRI